VDKAKADGQRHAGERQHHHLKVRKAVVGKQRKIVHAPPKDIPVISRSEPAEGSWWRPVYLNKRFRSASTEPPAVLDEFAIGTRDGDAGAGKGWRWGAGAKSWKAIDGRHPATAAWARGKRPACPANPARGVNPAALRAGMEA